MPWLNAFIGQQTLALHKKGIEAELEKYGVQDGYYPKLVYQHLWYKNNPDKWSKMDCSMAEEIANNVSKNMATNNK
jgi:hypothetical protein